MYIGCQSITWGPEMNRKHTEMVMAQVKEAGFQGIEIGARHLDPERVSNYAELLEQMELQLVALHIGGDFLNPESVASQLQNIKRTIETARQLGAKYIFLSGTYRENKTAEDYKIEAQNYNDIGMLCQDAGLELCYHNHDWEIKNDCKGYRILLEETRENLMGLVPDVGWMKRGGAQPDKLIKELYSRVKAVHFKDFTAEGGFTELGTGIVDFPAVYEIFKEKESFWMVSEQDSTQKTPVESARENYQYISSLL